MDDIRTNGIEDKIVSVLNAKASQEELAEVRQWLSESDGNRRLYDEYAAIWASSWSLRRHNDYQPDVAWTLLSKRMKMEKADTQYGIPIRKIVMVAAMIAVVFLAGMSVHYFSDQSAKDMSPLTYTEYSSPYGSKSKVKLPDGSMVWLNAGSFIRYSSDFNITNREIYLEGECYFDVAHHENISFQVQTSTITVKALGTAFNVKAYPEESFVETTVERGAVQLIDPMSSSQETTILRARQKAVAVKAVQPVEKPKETPLQDNEPSKIKSQKYIPMTNVEVNSNVKTEAYTSWKDTRWIIEREKLSSFAVKLERRYNVRFVFDDEELKDYVFSAKLEDETLNQVLEAIKLTAPILYKVQQNTVYLSRNKSFK